MMKDTVTRAPLIGVLMVLCLTALVKKTSAQATWVPTGPLNVARANADPQPFLVLLDDGRALAVAGVDDSGGNGLFSAEIYNPSAGSWSFTGSLGTARFYHTSTKLLDGMVLAAGGSDAALTSAELYDPNTEIWTATGSLQEPEGRANHMATLLLGPPLDGKVLIMGGRNPGGSGPPGTGQILNSAELYDPVSQMFSFTGSMGTPRAEFPATRLQDGTVLVAGGQVCGSGACTTTAAELYDPATETFSPTGSLATPRSIHTATLLLNGKVLIVGGTTTAPGSHTHTNTAEIYDPGTKTFGCGSFGARILCRQDKELRQVRVSKKGVLG